MNKRAAVTVCIMKTRARAYERNDDVDCDGMYLNYLNYLNDSSKCHLQSDEDGNLLAMQILKKKLKK